jgi:GDPmannose 4,6-dehydratase
MRRDRRESASHRWREAPKSGDCSSSRPTRVPVQDQDSARRHADGETFVTRKITRGLARIKLGMQDCLYLGNLDARRDWGHARDFVEMQWLMLQQECAEDFVIATGIQHSVREFVELAAQELGMPIRLEGAGAHEVGRDSSGRVVMRVDPRYYRPAEVDSLLGDAAKAREKLGWSPRTSFHQLVAEMVREDLKQAERDDLVKRHGYPTFDRNE